MDKADLRAARDAIHELLDSGAIQSYYGIELDGAGHYRLLLATVRKLIDLGVTSISQAKTKYGTLRIQLGLGSPPQARAIIDEAELSSATICIRCGEPGKLTRDFSWAAVLCEVHYSVAERTGRALAGLDDDKFGDADE